MLFVTINRGAKIVAEDCQIAHDLWRQGDLSEALEKMGQIERDLNTMLTQAREATRQLQAAIDDTP